MGGDASDRAGAEPPARWAVSSKLDGVAGYNPLRACVWAARIGRELCR